MMHFWEDLSCKTFAPKCLCCILNDFSCILFKFQAGGFLVSSNNYAIAEERELSENVYPNGDYVEASSFLEEVFS